MRTANIGALKNQYSADIQYVRSVEEVIVCDRKVPVARILPFKPHDDSDAEQAALIAAGKMTPPIDPPPRPYLPLRRPATARRRQPTRLPARAKLNFEPPHRIFPRDPGISVPVPLI